MNEWVRFDKPGVYRCYCCTSRVEADDGKNDRLPVVSQVVELKIVPADPAFVQATLADARRDLGDEKLRGQAVRTLRFLATPEAVEVLAGLADSPDVAQQAMFGLIGARDRAGALKALRAKLDDPDVALDHPLETAIVELSLSHEDLPVIDIGPHQPGQSYAEKLAALEQKKTHLAAELATQAAKGLTRKRGRALASTCAHLLFNAKMDDPQLRRSLAATFSQLTPDERTLLLGDGFWPLVKCPEFEHVLAKIAVPPFANEQWYWDGLQSLAVLRYGEYQPAKAHALILADICLPRPNLSRKAALSLPADSLPADLDAVLLKNFNNRKECDLDKVVPLIEQYGTKAILSDVLNVYQKFLLPFLDDPTADLVAQAARLVAEHGDSKCVEPLIAALERRTATTQPAHTYDVDELRSRYAIISALAGGTHFQLTFQQRGSILGLLKTDEEKSQFPTTAPATAPAAQPTPANIP